jgi:predicted AAA+ superfamily ATPase
MYRYKIKELIDWKLSEYRKPLIVLGARQVGKTWLIEEFGRQEYRQTVYVNFEKMKAVSNLFVEDFDVKRILTALSVFAHKEINPADTLIVFDEIQATEGGLTSLKYFCEDAPEYHVVDAGSLLGMSLHQNAIFALSATRNAASSQPTATIFQNTLHETSCNVSIWFGNQYLRNWQRKTKSLFTVL